ncbi:MAG TPA: hypothetical protein VIU12_13410 [Chryseolinea sp.]
MHFKTLCYSIASLVPGLVLSGKESIDRTSQSCIRSTISTTQPQITLPSQTTPSHKNKPPTVWIFTTNIKDKHFEVFGYGEDEEEGSIPNQWYCWEIELYHRKKIAQTSVIQGTKSLMLEISRKKRPRNHDWYRVRLSISDTHGSIGKDSVDLYLNR